MLQEFSARRVWHSIQWHADQDLDWLREYWAILLGVPAESIRDQRKSNSGMLGGRSWRSRYGVLTVGTDDTYLRARLQAWLDQLRLEWL